MCADVHFRGLRHASFGFWTSWPFGLSRKIPHLESQDTGALVRAGHGFLALETLAFEQAVHDRALLAYAKSLVVPVCDMMAMERRSQN